MTTGYPWLKLKSVPLQVSPSKPKSTLDSEDIMFEKVQNVSESPGSELGLDMGMGQFCSNFKFKILNNYKNLYYSQFY